MSVNLKPARFHVDLLQPNILNQLSSPVKVRILIELAAHAYHGRLAITARQLTDQGISTYETIRDTLIYFEKLGILTYDSLAKEYIFNYYRDMITDIDQYCKVYDFLLQDEFYTLSLPSIRAILYCLGLVSQSPHAPVRIDISTWYNRSDEGRLFPIYHRFQVLNILNDLSKYFVTDGKIYQGKYVYLKGLKPEYDKAAYTDKKYHWMTHFLGSFGIIAHATQMTHLVQLFDHYVSELGMELTREIWEQALRHLNSSKTKTARTIIGKLFEKCSKKMSQAVMILKTEFIDPLIDVLARNTFEKGEPDTFEKGFKALNYIVDTLSKKDDANQTSLSTLLMNLLNLEFFKPIRLKIEAILNRASRTRQQILEFPFYNWLE